MKLKYIRIEAKFDDQKLDCTHHLTMMNNKKFILHELLTTVFFLVNELFVSNGTVICVNEVALFIKSVFSPLSRGILPCVVINLITTNNLFLMPKWENVFLCNAPLVVISVDQFYTRRCRSFFYWREQNKKLRY